MRQPVDHVIRHAAEHGLQTSFAVRAGAGSGKTTVLTGRVVRLLESGVHPARIAAITFTEKAAGELQRRVRDQLETRRAEAPSETLDAALDEFHALTLSTVHSFCRKLLGDEPLTSRWAPGTRVGNQDMPGTGPALRAWRVALRQRDARVASLVDGLSDYKARKPLLHLVSHRELDPTGDPTLDWDALADELTALHQRVEALAAQCTNPKCKRLAKNAAFRSFLSASVANGADGVLEMLRRSGDPKPYNTGGTKGDWPGDSKIAFHDALDAVVQWVNDCGGKAHAVALSTMKEVALPVMIEAARAEAQASFDDLLFRAAGMLRHDETRARLADRFDALLIDEVQDTDPMQAEIAALLARAPTAQGAWTDHGPRPGGLFAVGDPKQSIYRFRRADVTVWDDLQRVVTATSPDGAVELQQNFRSVPSLVAWFNHTFAELPDYGEQAPWRSPAHLDPVVVIESEEDEEGELAADTRDAIAYLHQQIASGAEVVDRESGQARAMTWGDVMVLVPGWGRAHELAGAFAKSGVEAVVGGGTTFFQSDEVRLCLSALRAIDEPAEGECVVHVLRGLFGFSLDELAEHVSREGSWRYTIEDQPEGDVARALEVLRNVRRDSHETGSWVPRLDRLLEDSRALHVWSLLVDGSARLANLDKLRNMIREVEGETRSPSAVVERLRELAKKDDETELERMDEADDAVVITSVFKAKGLEAPVVVLFAMQRILRAPEVITDRRRGRVHFELGGLKPFAWAELRAAEKDALEEERARWMYVAATRARDQLVVVRPPKANLLAHLARGLPAQSESEGRVQVSGVDVLVVQGSALPDPPMQAETFKGADPAIDALLVTPAGKGDPATEQRIDAQRATARAAKSACAKWKSVGEVATGRRGFDAGDVSDGGSARLGRAGGTLVHRVLELLDLSQPRAELREQAPALLRSLAAEAGAPDELADACVSVVDRILEHEVFDRIRAAPEHWKETPFAIEEPTRGGSRVISGVIDLCFPLDADKKRWVVVDWKSDSPAEGSATRQAYERQLALYAKALLQTLAPCEHVDTILVGPHPEIAADPEIDALELVDAGFAAELRRLLAAGASVPVVGFAVLDGGQLELAWEHAKVGLGLDLSAGDEAALRADGWTLVNVTTSVAGWARDAAAALRSALGIDGADEDGDTADDVGGEEEAS